MALALIVLINHSIKLEQRCFPNVNRKQAAEIDLDLQIPSNVVRANLAQICSASPKRAAGNQVFVPGVLNRSFLTLTFNLV